MDGGALSAMGRGLRGCGGLLRPRSWPPGGGGPAGGGGPSGGGLRGACSAAKPGSRVSSGRRAGPPRAARPSGPESGSGSAGTRPCECGGGEAPAVAARCSERWPRLGSVVPKGPGQTRSPWLGTDSSEASASSAVPPGTPQDRLRVRRPEGSS